MLHAITLIVDSEKSAGFVTNRLADCLHGLRYGEAREALVRDPLTGTTTVWYYGWCDDDDGQPERVVMPGETLNDDQIGSWMSRRLAQGG